MRKYDIKLIDELSNVILTNHSKVTVKIKPIPDENRLGALDPRVFNYVNCRLKTTIKATEEKSQIENINVEGLRCQMGSVNEDLTENKVEISNKLIKVNDHYINANVYGSYHKSKKKTAIVFLHGGGFLGGSSKILDNQCKLLSEKSDSIVISLDYRLAPENPFPCAIEDCIKAIEWIYDNSICFGIDKDKIVVAGESAGANLAAVCSLNDKRNLIKLQIFIYGALDLIKKEDTFYNWNYDLYEIFEDHRNCIISRLDRFSNLNKLANELYIQNGFKASNPNISPIYSEKLYKSPKTLIIEAEFDYFRICNDIFAEKLAENGVDVEVIRYLGMDHGFFNRLGDYPQAEDCIIEIAKAVRKL